MRLALGLALLAAACKPPPPPAPPPEPVPEESVVRGADGVPMLTIKRAGEVTAIFDLAGQLVGSAIPTSTGVKLRDRFDQPLCEITRGPGGARVTVDDKSIRARSTATGLELSSEGEPTLTLTGTGVRETGLAIAQRTDGYDVERAGSVLFQVEGPLDPRAALALALGNFSFPTRVCLMLAANELD